MTIDLDAILYRANAASPGTWSDHKRPSIFDGYSVIDRYGGVLLNTNSYGKMGDDATFIAAARTDVPALVARVRDLESELRIEHVASKAALQILGDRLKLAEAVCEAADREVQFLKDGHHALNGWQFLPLSAWRDAKKKAHR